MVGWVETALVVVWHLEETRGICASFILRLDYCQWHARLDLGLA